MFTYVHRLPENVAYEQRLAVPIQEQLVPEEKENTSQAHQVALATEGVYNAVTNEERLFLIGDRYKLLVPANDGGWIQGLDLYTNASLHCHIHNTKRFLELSHLISTTIEGTRQPYDIQGLGNEVAILYPQFYGALHGYLKQKKNLSEFEAAMYFKQIISIINNAHKNSIALRDLKLKKFVFADPNKSTIYLSDLEDAVKVSGPEMGGDMLNDRHGCPAYVAPEMLQPGSYSGRAADMWSAGVILYTLLVGHYPFYDQNTSNIFLKIRLGHYHIPDYLSFSARSLICSLLSYEPGTRPSAEAVSYHPWLTNPPKHVEMVAVTMHNKHTDVDQTVPTHKLL